jgi:uncharacterized membrane protein
LHHEIVTWAGLAVEGLWLYPLILIVRLCIRLLLAALFLLAGNVHLLNPRFFLPIMPPVIPFPLFCIVASGVCEVLGGLGLLMPQAAVQKLAGWGLVLLLLAVFPANVYMATAQVRIHGFPQQAWMGWARLPLQPLLILAVVWVTGIWPRAATR